MNETIIKSFLVGLGFGVDEASLASFNKALASATVRVVALYASIKVAAAGIFLSISKISEGFEQMGYEYRIIAPMINKALVMRRELLKAYAAAGINITKVVQQSLKFNMSLYKTQVALKAIYQSVGAKFFPLLTRQMDVFRAKIYANMPKIQATLEKFVKFIFKAFEATAILGARVWSILQRVYDFFYKLHNATDGWSTVIVGVIAAWRLLNLSFLATPLGMLITGFVALLALWDDFKTFKEGGESLIDWGSKSVKVIVGVAAAVATVATAVGAVVVAMRAWAVIQTVINALLTLNPIGLLIVGITALVALLTTLAVKLGYLKGVGDFFSGLGDKVMNFAGGDNVAENMKSNPAVRPNPNPVSGMSQTNQNVNQQTSIQVNSSADANSVGKAVAGQQGRVNFDMARNLKGATR